MSAVLLPIGRLFLCTTLLLMTAALHAAPVPWLSYEQADPRESMLRLAKEKNIDWVDPLSHIFLLEDRGQTNQAIHEYEQFITLHASEADSLAIVLPLYWRWMEAQEAFEQRAAFSQNLSDTHQTGMVFQLLFLLEQWLDGLALAEISGQAADPVSFPHLLQTQEQLLTLAHSMPFSLRYWVAALIDLHSPIGGLTAANQYLMTQQEAQTKGQDRHNSLYGLITVYRKILFEMQGQVLPEQNNTGSWLLPGAGADMTTQAMVDRQHWAYKRFVGKAASTISSAWQSLAISVNCFYKARTNPQLFRFRLCLTPFDAARQNLSVLKDLLYEGDNFKRRAPWRDRFEWDAGDDEYRLLVYEFNEVAGFKESVSGHLQQDFQHQINQIKTIADPEVREAQKLSLYQSHMTDFASQQSVQNAVHHSAQRLNQIQDIKAKKHAIEQAFQRFKARQQSLTSQLQRSPNDENLITQYLSLIDSQDALKGLVEHSRQSLRVSVVQWLEKAQHNNRLDRLYQSYTQQKEAILSRFNENPLAAYEDLLTLVNSEAGESLSPESRQAQRDYFQAELQTLRLEQQAKQARKNKEARYNQRLNELNQQQEQSGNTEDWLMGFIDLLNSEDATVYPADWRAKKVRESRKALAKIEEKKRKVEEAKAQLAALEQEIAEREATEKQQQEERQPAEQQPQESKPDSVTAHAESSPQQEDLDPFDLDEDWGDDDEEEWISHTVPADNTEPDTQLLFNALEALGRGEDPLTQGIERTTGNLVKISYQHFPEATEQVLGALSHIDDAINTVVEFIDDSTGNTASAVWQTLDEPTQVRILGAGKVLSMVVPTKGLGALRAAKYSIFWPEASLKTAIEKFCGIDPLISITEKGKKIYSNPKTGLQVVEDLNGKYFRIFDPKIRGKRAYLDMNGNIPNNKKMPSGKEMGRSQEEYNQVTHFKILGG